MKEFPPQEQPVKFSTINNQIYTLFEIGNEKLSKIGEKIDTNSLEGAEREVGSSIQKELENKFLSIGLGCTIDKSNHIKNLQLEDGKIFLEWLFETSKDKKMQDLFNMIVQHAIVSLQSTVIKNHREKTGSISDSQLDLISLLNTFFKQIEHTELSEIRTTHSDGVHFLEALKYDYGFEYLDLRKNEEYMIYIHEEPVINLEESLKLWQDVIGNNDEAIDSLLAKENPTNEAIAYVRERIAYLKNQFEYQLEDMVTEKYRTDYISKLEGVVSMKKEYERLLTNPDALIPILKKHAENYRSQVKPKLDLLIAKLNKSFPN